MFFLIYYRESMIEKRVTFQVFEGWRATIGIVLLAMAVFAFCHSDFEKIYEGGLGVVFLVVGGTTFSIVRQKRRVVRVLFASFN